MDVHGVDFNRLLESEVDVECDGKNKYIIFNIDGYKEVINFNKIKTK